MLNAITITYSVKNDESLRGHCTNERRVRKRDINSLFTFYLYLYKKVKRDATAEDKEREGGSTSDV